MEILHKYWHCFVAGAFAASGSFFGKLPSVLHTPEESPVSAPAILARYLPLALMVLCNVLNWRFFLKALHRTDETLTATVATSASNYVVSFILAAVVYRESFSVLSSIGCALIVAGLWFLCGAPREMATKKD